MIIQLLVFAALVVICIALLQIADYLRLIASKDDRSDTTSLDGIGTNIADSINRLSLILGGNEKIEAIAKNNLQALKKQFYEAYLETGTEEKADEQWEKSISGIEYLLSTTRWTDELLWKRKTPHRITYAKMFENGMTTDDYLPLLKPTRSSA